MELGKTDQRLLLIALENSTPSWDCHLLKSTKSINDYLAKIPRQVDSITLKQTMPLEIDMIIRNLPNKISHGHDEISNIMLKALQSSISFPLCHIFNHSLLEGSFPERMKWAEIIPLYQGKNMDITVNY